MNSVLSPGVRVDVGAVVRDSIVMFDPVIRSGAVVDRAILDKEVVVGQGAIVGDGPYDGALNRQEPGRLNTGITVVGKQSIVPAARDSGATSRLAATCATRTTRVASSRPAARSTRSRRHVRRPPRSDPSPRPPPRAEPGARATWPAMPAAADIERWLSELGLQPGPRVEREGVVTGT